MGGYLDDGLTDLCPWYWDALRCCPCGKKKKCVAHRAIGAILDDIVTLI